MSTRTKTLEHPEGWKIVLDADQIVPDDPGAGTPAMVHGPRGQSGTYFAVYENEEIGRSDGSYEQIPRSIARWLDEQFDEVEAFMSAEEDGQRLSP